jgi:thioredoxin-related protein
MQQAKFKTVALPFYVIVDSKGDEIITFPGLTRKEEGIVSFLQIGQ